MEQIVVCRTCLRETKKYVSIFSAPKLWGKNIVLAKLIMACAPVAINVGDNLPSKICDNCLQLLQLSFLFRLRVLTANENYKNIIRTQVNDEKQTSSAISYETKKLNQIYSAEYIFESIKESQPKTCAMQPIKQEPLDIKEELKDSKELSSSIASAVSTLESTIIHLENKRIQNNQTKETINNKKMMESNSSNIENVDQYITIGNKIPPNNVPHSTFINQAKRTFSNMQNSESLPNNNLTNKIPKKIIILKKEGKQLKYLKKLIPKNPKIIDINECIIIDD